MTLSVCSHWEVPPHSLIRAVDYSMFMESFTRSGGGLETAAVARSPRIRAVGWGLETHRNEWHRSHTAVLNERWPPRIKTLCMNRPLLILNKVLLFQNSTDRSEASRRTKCKSNSCYSEMKDSH